MSIAVVYIARGKDSGIESSSRFLDSYANFDAGIPHKLYVIEKGWDSKGEINTLRGLVENLGGNLVSLSDDGFDWGAYIRIAPYITEEWVCFLNTHSEIAAQRWLYTLFEPFRDEDVGLVGCSGSWSTWTYSHPFWRPSLKYSIQYPVRLLIEIYRFIRNRDKYYPFPNYHIRSNAFIIRTADFQEFCTTIKVPNTKADCHYLESGKTGISAFIESKNKRLLVRGSDGVSYAKNEWDKSRTFRSLNQENLIIKDNQTRNYENSNHDKRILLTFKSWQKKNISRQKS